MAVKQYITQIEPIKDTNMTCDEYDQQIIVVRTEGYPDTAALNSFGVWDIYE